MQTYRELETWKQAMGLVTEVYKVTAAFPRHELYGLTGQLRRAAISIPANLAEGHCRRKTRPYADHVSIALGSHAELETCFEIASRLGFLSDSVFAGVRQQTDTVGKLLSGLYRSIESRLEKSSV